VIHGASIITAVCGLTGLHNYRFGRSATVSWHRSMTPVEVLFKNRSIDAHTLLFLDLHPPMTINQALEALIEIENKVSELYAVGIARAGGGDVILKCDKARKLVDFDFGKPLHTLVFLAKTLHFMEYECLRSFADAPEDLEAMVK
jgi:diphthine synthase